MRFVIIQPSWDHSEILSSLLFFIKKANYQVKIIYDWSHPEGNYLDYLCELLGFGDNIKINYKSPKHHIRDLETAHKIIFVDEIHLKKFFSKGVFIKMINKCYTFNHLTKKILYDIKVLSLGVIPYTRCINEKKYLVNSYYNPKNSIKILNNKIIKFLIVGNPKERNLKWLEHLPQRDNYLIYFIHRKDIEINHPNVIVKKNLATNELINLIDKIDYIITLFKENSCYYKDRISGILPYAISFGKPIIMDTKFNEINKFYFIENKLVYENNLINFLKIFEQILELDNNKYQNYCEKILKYRDSKISEQYLNFHLIFN